MNEKQLENIPNNENEVVHERRISYLRDLTEKESVLRKRKNELNGRITKAFKENKIHTKQAQEDLQELHSILHYLTVKDKLKKVFGFDVIDFYRTKHMDYSEKYSKTYIKMREDIEELMKRRVRNPDTLKYPEIPSKEKKKELLALYKKMNSYQADPQHLSKNQEEPEYLFEDQEEPETEKEFAKVLDEQLNNLMDQGALHYFEKYDYYNVDRSKTLTKLGLNKWDLKALLTRSAKDEVDQGKLQVSEMNFFGKSEKELRQLKKNLSNKIIKDSNEGKTDTEEFAKNLNQWFEARHQLATRKAFKKISNIDMDEFCQKYVSRLGIEPKQQLNEFRKEVSTVLRNGEDRILKKNPVKKAELKDEVKSNKESIRLMYANLKKFDKKKDWNSVHEHTKVLISEIGKALQMEAKLHALDTGYDYKQLGDSNTLKKLSDEVQKKFNIKDSSKSSLDSKDIHYFSFDDDIKMPDLSENNFEQPADAVNKDAIKNLENKIQKTIDLEKSKKFDGLFDKENPNSDKMESFRIELEEPVKEVNNNGHYKESDRNGVEIPLTDKSRWENLQDQNSLENPQVIETTIENKMVDSTQETTLASAIALKAQEFRARKEQQSAKGISPQYKESEKRLAEQNGLENPQIAGETVESKRAGSTLEVDFLSEMKLKVQEIRARKEQQQAKGISPQYKESEKRLAEQNGLENPQIAGETVESKRAGSTLEVDFLSEMKLKVQEIRARKEQQQAKGISPQYKESEKRLAEQNGLENPQIAGETVESKTVDSNQETALAIASKVQELSERRELLSYINRLCVEALVKDDKLIRENKYTGEKLVEKRIKNMEKFFVKRREYLHNNINRKNISDEALTAIENISLKYEKFDKCVLKREKNIDSVKYLRSELEKIVQKIPKEEIASIKKQLKASQLQKQDFTKELKVPPRFSKQPEINEPVIVNVIEKAKVSSDLIIETKRKSVVKPEISSMPIVNPEMILKSTPKRKLEKILSPQPSFTKNAEVEKQSVKEKIRLFEQMGKINQEKIKGPIKNGTKNLERGL
ncbi:hypothetical protein [Enterococcus ratti]|uniref:Uncharacterized protein n=1 Tax=Enterococcus ratti TaxID=150033 RepID=A0A1L8WR02_9ENTE|nr:hypothetical protein [Enterococcus ratti]OJG83441.1 hypothetical protein RV14_GL001319 [Enterococcus ratti]